MQDKKLKILTVGAHPDDCELSTGGVCIKYKKLGHEVKYVYATNGDAGHHKMGGEKLAKIRALEVKDACAVADFDYEIMDNHDGYLEANISNRDSLIRIIRKFQPDIIFTHRTNDYHPDHRATAVLVQDASFLIMVPNVCPDVPALDYSPVIMYVSDIFNKPLPFAPDIVIDIDDVMETKVKIVDCHKSQFYEWLPWIGGYESDVPSVDEEKFAWLFLETSKRYNKIAERFRTKLIEHYGAEKGLLIKCAEAFEISEYGGQLDKEKMSVFFPF